MSLLVRIVLAVGVIIGGAVYVTGIAQQSSLEAVLEFARLTPDDLPELLQRIRDFHRVITRDGERLLEISAEEASYFKNEKAVIVKAPKVIFFDDNVPLVTVQGNEGRLYLNGNDVASVELNGSVVLQLGNFRLTAENLSFDREKEEIRVMGATEITSEQLTLTGTDLVIDMVKRALVMEADVHLRVQSAG